MPRSIGALYLPRALKRSRGDRLRALTELDSIKERHGFTAAVTIVDGEDDATSNTAVRIDNLYCQAVPRETGVAAGQEDPSQLVPDSKARGSETFFITFPVA